MKKIVAIIVIGVLFISGFGVVALNIETKNNFVTIKDKVVEIDLSSVKVVENNNEVSFSFTHEELYLLNPGQPIVPKIIKKYELPFGITNINVNLIPKKVIEMDIQNEIKPAPSPIPMTPFEGFVSYPKRDSTVYNSAELFPKTWFNYNVGCGLNRNGEHVTYLIVHIYPIRYSPLLNKLNIVNKADIIISYVDSDDDIFSATSEYDLVIIAPSIFQADLEPLVEHKNNFGTNTILKTTEDIYAEYTGFDKAEQIKYFIKDALEQWNIKYVLLAGGLKSIIYSKARDNTNIGASGWHIPIRYSNIDENGDKGFPSDLYYADIYKAGGEFENWDSDGDGILAEWPDDIIDLIPDVAVGRLAFSDSQEVQEVVNKIINYETTTYGSDWFKKIIVISGDGFLDQFDLNIQWDTKEFEDGAYIIKAQSFNPEGDQGPVDVIHITLDKTAESQVTFNHDDHLNPILQNGYPAPPIAEIISVSEGNILGNTDVTYEPSGGEAYCNDLFWYGNVSYIDEVLIIRGKSYDPKPYGNLTNIHVWIENNQGDVVFSDWRNNTPTYYEGEWVTGEEAVNGRGGALFYMPEEFDRNILWTSNGKFTGPDDVINSYSEGYGFAFFSGHGSPGVWQDQNPGIPGNRQYATVQGLWVSYLRSFPPFISQQPVWPMKELSNNGKLPITVVGGCHNSLFTVSLIPSALNYYLRVLGRDNEMWTGIEVVPQCWSWYLVQLPNTGAIATIGNTGLGWGWEGEFCTVGAGDGWISSEFFKQYGEHYGEEGYQTLGQLYLQTQTSYVNTFKDFTLPECWWYPDLGWDAIDEQTVQQWVLLGDPSLMIGGYE